MRTLNIEFPDNINFPERRVQQFDYSNNNRECVQSDIDFVFMKDGYCIIVESKTEGTDIRGGQKRLLDALCSDEKKCAVVVHHQSSVHPVVKLVDGWGQTVSECYYNGQWFQLDGRCLKDFVNDFFRTIWNYDEDVVT